MTKTLLVDGNNLLKIGFHGVKDYFNNGEHIGGLWHFLNTLRRFIDEENFSKVVVFWDGETSTSQRRLIYPKYKLNRKGVTEDFKELSFNKQKQRVKEYLEEMFVRQVEFENSEADDLIAYYCKISKDEYKTIFSGDRDLTQLISEAGWPTNPVESDWSEPVQIAFPESIQSEEEGLYTEPDFDGNDNSQPSKTPTNYEEQGKNFLTNLLFGPLTSNVV